MTTATTASTTTDDKLKNLTQKLYLEGVERGKKAGDDYLTKARSEAQKTVTEAQEKAKKILQDATTEAANIKKRVELEISLTSNQILNRIKEEITQIIALPRTTQVVREALADQDFIKKMIIAVIQKWDLSSAGPIDLKIALPDSLQKDLETFIKKECHAQMNRGLEITFDRTLSHGMRLGPKDSSYQIELSESGLVNLMSTYIKPFTRNILFKD
jgi:V/A-type H+/Na+-transporting ATPase subunit E